MKQYRFVILGNIQSYYSHFLYSSLEGAIRNGAWAKTVQLTDRPVKNIRDEIDFMKPHFLLAHTIFGPMRMDVLQMLGEIRRKYGTKIMYHMGDAREMPRYPHPIDEWVDLGLVNHGDYEKFSNIWRIPCIHWPYMCFYQEDIADVDPRYISGLAFTGDLTADKHHGPRKQFIQQLRSTMNIKTYPTPETGNTRFQTAELASSAAGILGMQMGENIPLYQDVRPFQYIGSGSVYFHDQCEAMDTFFEPEYHYVPYKRNDAKHLKMQYDRFTSPEESVKIRRQAFEFCQRYHSSKERIESIIRYFEGEEPLPIYLKDLM